MGKNVFKFSNADFSNFYGAASKKGRNIRGTGNDEDISYCEQEYEREIRTYSDNVYDKDGKIDLLLATRELARGLKIANWKRFKSPPEVSAYFGGTLIWDPRLIFVNQQIFGFEIDHIFCDIYRNPILCHEVNGYEEHRDRKEQDAAKKAFIEAKGIPVWEVSGSFIRNEFWTYCDQLALELKKAYKKRNIEYISPDDYRKQYYKK